MLRVRTPDLLAVCVVAAAACAQTTQPLTNEEQRTLEQIALGHARGALFERVLALPLAERSTVGDRLAEDAERDRALRLWVRTRPAIGKPRHYSDQVCEVDVRVDPNDLEVRLAQLAADGLEPGRLHSAARTWGSVWATGRATPTERGRGAQPIGWEEVTVDGVAMTGAAATADAQHALLEQAARLKISRTRRLGEFFAVSAEIRAAVAAEIARAASAKLEYAPDQVAVAEARLPIRELLRVLTRVHEEQYRGDDFAAADFREMVLLAGANELVATGLATPPNTALLLPRYLPIEHNAPEWANRSLTAVGRCVPAHDEKLDETARSAAARLDGLDQLSRQASQLVIQKRTTVGEFVGYHQDLKDDIVLWLSGARAAAPATTQADGTTELKVELPARRLWEIVRRRMKVEEVEPAEDRSHAPWPLAAHPEGVADVGRGLRAWSVFPPPLRGGVTVWDGQPRVSLRATRGYSPPPLRGEVVAVHPEGVQGCSHGWRHAQRGDTRGTSAQITTHPEGVAEFRREYGLVQRGL